MRIEEKSRKEYLKQWAKDNPDKVKANRLRFKERNPTRWKQYQVKHMYDLSPEDHNQLKIAQDNTCAICGSPPPKVKKKELDVDHDHRTGKVRGLLCNNCNRGIGHLQDSIKLLENALKYLKKHKE